MQEFINSYYYSDIIDFTNSTQDMNLLLKVADFTAYPGCTTNSFTSDDWVPSIRGTTIACTNSTAHQASAT
jgi:hypothetical protein